MGFNIYTRLDFNISDSIIKDLTNRYNPFEKETFLKRTGPQLPQVKKRTKKSYA